MTFTQVSKFPASMTILGQQGCLRVAPKAVVTMMIRGGMPLRARPRLGKRPVHPASSRCCWYHEISFAKHGKIPRKVLEYRSDPGITDLEPPSCSGKEYLRVEMMHAPWNPADINMVQGRYPSPYPSSPTSTNLRIPTQNCLGRYFDGNPVPGSEGWGRITHSSTHPKGTLVALGLPGLGSLRSSLWVPADAILPVAESLYETLGPGGVSLFQLGGTALRMLSDFVTVKPGEIVLQNAGTSGVGFLASQLVASPSFFGDEQETTPRMVSFIRGHNQKAFENSCEYLTKVGKNALVFAEDDFFVDTNDGRRSIDDSSIRRMRDQLRSLSPTGSLPRLALNAVGGDSARLLWKLLEPNASSTMVTYGGMSGQPIEVATPQLIFADVRAVGYWHSRWMVRQQTKPMGDSRASMVETLSRLALDEDLQCPPARVFRLKDFRDGLTWQSEGSGSQNHPIRAKLVWDCSE